MPLCMLGGKRGLWVLCSWKADAGGRWQLIAIMDRIHRA